MQIPKLKVLVEAGAVRQVEAIPESAGGWTVQVTYASRRGERREVLERQRGGTRVFVMLDAVARALAGLLPYAAAIQIRPQGNRAGSVMVEEALVAAATWVSAAANAEILVWAREAPAIPAALAAVVEPAGTAPA